jgi:transposase
MPDTSLIERIRDKYRCLWLEFDERGRRRWAAVEAQSLGRGGINAVAQATGISDRTIRNGIKELASAAVLPPERQRRRGAGRKSYQESQPGLRQALDDLVNPTTRGDPTNPLRWTCKSTRALAAELRQQGFQVSPSTIRGLLVNLGYSLQANRKTREGKQHPDRDAQFRHINQRVRGQKRRGEPAISVDTKKKEVLGNKKNPGRTYEPKGHPRTVDTHDFPDAKKGKGRVGRRQPRHGRVCGQCD